MSEFRCVSQRFIWTLVAYHTQQLELRIKMSGLILDESEFGTYPGEWSELTVQTAKDIWVYAHTYVRTQLTCKHNSADDVMEEPDDSDEELTY